MDRDDRNDLFKIIALMENIEEWSAEESKDSLAEFTSEIWRVYSSFRNVGFSDDQALQLTIEIFKEATGGK